MKNQFQVDARSIGEQGQYALRLIIIRNVNAGKKDKEIADTLGISAAYVGKVRKIYAEKGEEGLQIKHRGRQQGQKRILSQEQEQEIKRVILEHTPEEYGFQECLWTRSNIHAMILEKYDIDMKLTTLWNYLHRWGLSAQRPVRRERKQDAEKIEQWLNYDYPEIRKRANEEGAEIFFVTRQMCRM
jgi:transposase